MAPTTDREAGGARASAAAPLARKRVTVPASSSVWNGAARGLGARRAGSFAISR
jgi:hypothetical protein